MQNTGSPRRVFDSASLLIAGFEQLDDNVTPSVDSKIESVLLLEDIEAGSITIWLKNILKAIPDEGLKDLEWKKAVGTYLLKAKYVALRWLDSGSEEQPPALANLTRELQALAVQTDVRYLPDYPPPSEGRLVSALGTIQDGKRQLIPGDRLVIETEDKVYEVYISRDWSPSTAADEGVETETSSYGEMILTIRKPDTIGNTQWQFKHGKQNISAPIYDNEWLRKYHERKLDIRPGDALRCRIKFVNLESQRMEIDKILEVIRRTSEQLKLIDD